jgi:hypothetical protein
MFIIAHTSLVTKLVKFLPVSVLDSCLLSSVLIAQFVQLITVNIWLIRCTVPSSYAFIFLQSFALFSV